VVNFTGWQAASPEGQIFRAKTTDDGYQIRAKQQLENGGSGQDWPLIILATILGLLAAAIVAAGAAAFMFRKTIITGILAATLGPRATEITVGMQATTDDSGGLVKSWENLLTETSRDKPEVKKEKATGASKKGQRSRKKPEKEEGPFDMEKLTKFMISPQHSMDTPGGNATTAGTGSRPGTLTKEYFRHSTRDVKRGRGLSHRSRSSRRSGKGLRRWLLSYHSTSDQGTVQERPGRRGCTSGTTSRTGWVMTRRLVGQRRN
jgi:hypothetical protein